MFVLYGLVHLKLNFDQTIVYDLERDFKVYLQ